MLRERRRHANFKPNRKLDRKSSRGMIYENEELRLRTININAEVERGQSDIKKLLRENYRLRTENWTLRDEYDRLDKLLKSKNQPNGHARDFHNAKFGCDYNDSYRCCNCLPDDDNVSCDMCNNNEHFIKDFDDQKPSTSINGDKSHGYGVIKSNKTGPASMPAAIRNEKINMNFDHLSVVSEECLSNSDEQMNQNCKSNNEPNESAQDPIYTNFQSTIPPLQHFENLSYKDIGPNIDSSGEIQFNGEMYQANEQTPPPPSPPPPSAPPLNRRSTSLPLPPPPTITEEGNIVQDDTNEIDKPTPKYFFAPLKSKRKASMSAEQRPDIFVNNIVASDGNRVATIRKPHNPLKYPSNLNADSIDTEVQSLKDVQGLSKGIETMQMQSNAVYENVTSSDSDQTPPYRTEMSLVLSYSGNKSKYSTTQNADKKLGSENDSPPTNFPHAMKLLPNKLTYTAQNEILKPKNSQSTNTLNEVNQPTSNDPSKEELFSSHVESAKNNVKCMEKLSGEKPVNEESNMVGEARAHVDSVHSNASKESTSKSKSRNSNESQESKETGASSKNSHGNIKDSRRVSIHFNGKPITDQLDATEPHSNDTDLNTTDLTEEELLAIPPMSYLRSRRTSCSRRVNDEIGTFLYPPNPFAIGSHKRGRRSSFLSRRHSDGIIATRPTQYHLDYALMAKPAGRCHCHRGHMQNNHLGVDGYCGDFCNGNLGGSTGSSIGNNMNSSRESLGNISQQSSRRKISITSHSKSGGKIPWCACWGNGCL